VAIAGVAAFEAVRRRFAGAWSKVQEEIEAQNAPPQPGHYGAAEDEAAAKGISVDAQSAAAGAP
jgi:hypothetical protein